MNLVAAAMLAAGGYQSSQITHPIKKIPAKYNTESELGFDFQAGDHVQPPVLIPGK